ncbi:MAG: hypothetical protein IJC54_01480 [Clostridia bacterium]|nr:hypothetical protein [Clostridia bacterium]
MKKIGCLALVLLLLVVAFFIGHIAGFESAMPRSEAERFASAFEFVTGMQIDVPDGSDSECLVYTDTHGGFLGDGCTVGIVQFGHSDAKEFEERIQSDPKWEERSVNGRGICHFLELEMGIADGEFALESKEVDKYDYMWSHMENWMTDHWLNYKVCLYDSETGTLAMYVLDY